MAQTTILAAGQTEVASSDFVVAAGAIATVGLFVASGELPAYLTMKVMLDTPGADIQVHELSRDRPAVAVSGPGTFRVLRGNARGVNVGVFTES